MLKTNIKNQCIVGFACFIATAVLMLSVHAKDLAHFTDLRVAREVELHELSAKAAADLHSHVDKQIVKTFDKAMNDNPLLSVRARDDLNILSEEDPGLWGRFHETFLIWRIFASLPFSVNNV